jgi:hypothetical protein
MCSMPHAARICGSRSLRPVQNADRSASRWLLTGTAVLAVREEGKLLTDWVERRGGLPTPDHGVNRGLP